MVTYFFGFIFPVLFNIIIRSFGGNIAYGTIISVWGYSLTINIITLLLCAYPNNEAQNFFITYGAIHSSIFLYLCLKNEFRNRVGNLKYIAIGILALCQLTLIMVYKIFFFKDLYIPDD